MSNEEKILFMPEGLILDVKEIKPKVNNLETKVDKLENRMIAAEKQVARNMKFILEEFEKSYRRILGYLEGITLDETGEKVKAGFGLT